MRLSIISEAPYVVDSDKKVNDKFSVHDSEQPAPLLTMSKGGLFASQELYDLGDEYVESALSIVVSRLAKLGKRRFKIAQEQLKQHLDNIGCTVKSGVVTIQHDPHPNASLQSLSSQYADLSAAVSQKIEMHNGIKSQQAILNARRAAGNDYRLKDRGALTRAVNYHQKHMQGQRWPELEQAFLDREQSFQGMRGDFVRPRMSIFKYLTSVDWPEGRLMVQPMVKQWFDRLKKRPLNCSSHAVSHAIANNTKNAVFFQYLDRYYHQQFASAMKNGDRESENCQQDVDLRRQFSDLPAIVQHNYAADLGSSLMQVYNDSRDYIDSVEEVPEGMKTHGQMLYIIHHPSGEEYGYWADGDRLQE